MNAVSIGAAVTPSAVLLLIVLVLAPNVHAQSADPDSASARVTRLADAFIAAVFERYPEAATFYARPGADHGALTDVSPEAKAAWEAREDAWYAALQGVDPALLAGRPEWTTYGFLLEALASSRQRRVCEEDLWRVDQLDGWQVFYPMLAEVQPVGTDPLREAALRRLRALPGVIDGEIANLRDGLHRGYSAPRGSVERVLAQLDSLLASPPPASPFYAPARRDSTAAFQAAVAAAIVDELYPAIARYRDFLRGEYLAQARTETAVAANPGGAACYRALVRAATSLDLSPEEVHRLGRETMEEIEEEMREVSEQSFETDDVRALLERLRTDAAFLFSSREEVRAHAEAALERARTAMPAWFGRLPQADVVVEPYPPHEEASAPIGSYLPPADDGSRPGTYRINLYKPEAQPRAGLEATAFHETIPGHHLQIALAMERPGAHDVTRFLGATAFVEGWGLYAERLADEMGLYSSDLDRMGMLSNEALRAARLVVDPGLHALGWSRQEAIDYMAAHTAESLEEIATEVDRYIIRPGQATAYTVGSQEIQRLRAEAEAALGEGFDVRAFHDTVLGDGGVTLPMLRAKVERWISERR